jgi:hypothetical protein
MKRFALAALGISLTLLTACGNNDSDNDTATMGTDTTMAAPADGMTDAGATGANGTGNATDGAMNSSSPSSNMNNGGGADNTGTGVSGGQGSNSRSGSNAAGVRTGDGAAPTSTRQNRDDVTNDSLNNRTGMGSSR